MLFFLNVLFIKESWKYVLRFPQNYDAQMFGLIIRNVCSAANDQVRVISEGSCDTEAWSNDAENTALTSQ